MNDYWEKYGCNEHDVVILVTTAADIGSDLVNAYKAKGYTPKFPIIDKNNGARDVIASYGGSAGSGGPCRMIKPDKSHVSGAWYSDPSAVSTQFSGFGIQENSCDDTYKLTVNSGSGDGDHEEGASVTITADAAPTGKEFDKWTGDTQYLANVNSATTTVIMPGADISVTATYKDSGPIIKKDNFQTIATWEAGLDTLGSSVSIDSSKKNDTIISTSISLATSDETNEKWAWAQISGYVDGNFSNVTSVELLYYSDKPVNLVLDQEGLSDGGASYFYKLDPASRGKVTIPISSFTQPDWVATDAPDLVADLDLTKVQSISFAAVNEGATTNFEVQGIYLEGFQETPIIQSSHSQAINKSITVSSLTTNKLVLSNVKKGTYNVSVFNVAGKQLISLRKELKGNCAVDFGKNLTNGTYIVKIVGDGVSAISNGIIK